VPDSGEILIGGLTGRIESWRPQTQKLSRSILAFQPRDTSSRIKPAVQALASTKDGAFALLDDGRLMNFDSSNGHELARPATLADDIGKAAIGETGRLIVAASQSTGEVSAFSCGTKSAIESSLQCSKTPVAAGFADAVAVSERSGLAAVAMEQDGLMLVRLDQASPANETVDLPANARVASLAFDARGDRLAIGTMQGEAFVIDLKGNRIALPTQTSSVTALAFDSTSSLLATSCDDFAVCIWKLPQAGNSDAEPLARLTGHTNTVLTLAFGPGSDSIVSTSEDETIKAWTVEAIDHVSFALPTRDKIELTELGVSADRKWLAAGNLDGGIELWDLASLTFVRPLPPLRPAEIRCLQWHPSKPLLAQTDKVGWLAIRPLAEDQQPIELKIDQNGNTVDVVRWLPGGSSVAVGLSGGEIKEWRPGGEPIAFAARHPDAVQGLAVDPRTNRLFSSDSYGNLWAWDLKTRKEVFDLPPVGTAQDVIDLSEEGRIALTAGNGGKVTLYDIEKARKFLRLDIGAESEGAGFSPDGKLIAAVDTEGKLHIWSFAADEADSDVFASVKVYPDELVGQASEATHLRRLAWLPELSAIVIASSRGEVKIISYDVSAWRLRAQSVFLSK
jgi:WD40 repeat protein